MLFKIRWYKKQPFNRSGGNRWFTNTFYDWDACEKRIDFLVSNGIQFEWIVANLDSQ